jgi:hypothetical protein
MMYVWTTTDNLYLLNPLNHRRKSEKSKDKMADLAVRFLLFVMLITSPRRDEADS